MTYKLTYFDAAGRAEPIRFLLKYGGFDFEDNRVSQDVWKKIKSDMPFGQLPVLEYDGKISHQSMAICRYLGKQAKLGGKDDWEDLEIDVAVDTFEDFAKNITEALQRKETVKELLVKEDVIYYLKKFDEQIKKNNGYLALGKLTWADLVFVSKINMLIRKTDNENLFSEYTNIEGLIKKVNNIPNIKEYLNIYSS